MAITHEIAVSDWTEFLPAFSKRNQGRPTRLEATVPPGEGSPVLAEHQPLLGVEIDPKGSAAPAIVVMLGGLDQGTPELTHYISDPATLWVEEEVGGPAVAISIESQQKGRTTLIFEDEKALPSQ